MFAICVYLLYHTISTKERFRRSNRLLWGNFVFFMPPITICHNRSMSTENIGNINSPYDDNRFPSTTFPTLIHRFDFTASTSFTVRAIRGNSIEITSFFDTIIRQFFGVSKSRVFLSDDLTMPARLL